MTAAVTIRDGKIFWRGAYRSPEDAEQLARQFDHVLAGDWFAPFSRQYAADLRAAIAKVKTPHTQMEIA